MYSKHRTSALFLVILNLVCISNSSNAQQKIEQKSTAAIEKKWKLN